MEEWFESGLFENRYINSWAVTPILEEPVCFEQTTQTGQINEWLTGDLTKYDNPGRKAFTEKRLSLLPEITEDGAGYMLLNGQHAALSPHLSFGEPNVTKSDFWYTPTLLRMVAVCELIADRAESAEFELSSCGRAILFVNGILSADTASFTRNRESTVRCSVSLSAGKNKLTVYLEDIAERDTDLYFRLGCETAAGCRQRFFSGASTEALRSVYHFLEDISFTRPSYSGGELVLRSGARVPEGKRLLLKLEAGTEENRTAGLLWKNEITVSDAEHIPIGKSEQLPVGYLDTLVTAELDGASLSRRLGVENLPPFLTGAPEGTIGERKRRMLRTLAECGEENIIRAVALTETETDPERAERLFRRQMKDIAARKDCSDFHLVWFPWLWRKYRASDRFTEDFWHLVKETVLGFRYWIDEPGNDVMWFFSENHALMFHTCQLLCGELFPDEFFPTPSLTGLQMQRKAKGLLKEWFDRFFREGCSEWNSSAYFPINGLGLGNLYLQTEDPEIKRMAARAMDKISLWLAQYGYRGFLASSAGRTYEKELFGNLANGTSAMSYVLFGNGCLNQAGKGCLALCLSDYAPPEECLSFISGKSDTECVSRMTQGRDGFVSLYSCKTDGYMLSSAICCHPGRKGYQEHPLQLVFDPVRQILISKPGEYALYGSGRPSYWAGSAELPLVWQYRGFAMMIFRACLPSPVPFTHMYLPEEETDETVPLDGRIYVKCDNAYAMIACSVALEKTVKGPLTKREWIARSEEAVWILRAGTDREFGDFASFIAKMRKCELLFSADPPGAVWQDPSYGELSGSWNERLCAAGKEVEYTEKNGEETNEWLPIKRIF